MAKFSKLPKLSKKQQNQLFVEFCQALADLKKPQDVALFLKDLVGPQELRMLAKRLAIAKLLIEGDTYDSIVNELKVSKGTVARVNLWLQMSGQGYQKAVEKIQKRNKPIDWEYERFKKRMGRYIWPHIVFENILKEIDKNKRRKLLKNLETIEDKGKIAKEFNRYLLEIYGAQKKSKINKKPNKK